MILKFSHGQNENDVPVGGGAADCKSAILETTLVQLQPFPPLETTAFAGAITTEHGEKTCYD